MKSNAYKSLILSRISLCDEFFTELKLNQYFNLNYYTIFTKSTEERKTLFDQTNKYLHLIDSKNGDTFEIKDNSFLPSRVRFLRIRLPDDSKTVVAGDVLGKNIEEVVNQLNSLNISFDTQERSNFRLLSIKSSDLAVTIYFPSSHFLTLRI